MKKIILILALVMTFSLVFTACGGNNQESETPESEGTGEVYTLKAAHQGPETYPLELAWLYLGEILDERTNGRIVVETYPNKQLASSDQEQAEMVRTNTIQMTTTPNYSLLSLNADVKELYVFDLPYVFKNNDEIYGFCDTEMGQTIINDATATTGVKVYAPVSLGWNMVASNKAELRTPNDIKGQKIRSVNSEVYMGMLSAWGANPTVVAYGEVYTALQQNTVDGMITGSTVLAADKFYEVLKYATPVNPNAIIHFPIVSQIWFDSLPEDLQVIFEESMVDYLEFLRSSFADYEKNAIQTLIDGGTIVTEPTADEMKAWIDMAQPVVEKNADICGGMDFVNAVREEINSL